MSLIEVKNISKVYLDVNKEYKIFSNISLGIDRGESVLLLGNSGCGKSTLLQIIGLIQNQTSGEVIIDGESFSIEGSLDSKKETSKVKKAKRRRCKYSNFDDIANYRDDDRTIYRNYRDGVCLSGKKNIENKRNALMRDKIGFIYQFHYLFNDFTALENLVIPQMIRKVDRDIAEENALRILKELNIEHRKDAMPYELSGGERQRVAIARAIIKKPMLILADEPTGNLDNDMSNFVVNEMTDLVREHNISLLMVTHNHDFRKHFDKSYELSSCGLKLV